jgi:uncharacterized protein (DUF983 family)
MSKPNVSLESRVDAIEKRNRRVEQDKSWEGSFVRRILILILTYIVVAVYMWLIIKIDPWINALVPAIGFLLSTLTMDWLKQKWIQNKYRENV